MQQLTVEHKKSTSNQKIVGSNENKVEELENKREGNGRNIALRNNAALRIVGSDTFYCKSESKDIWYFIRYEPSFHWCSCFDNSMRHVKCKHIFAVEYSIRKGTLQDVDKLPSFVIRDNMVSKSYRDDSYDF